MQEVVAYIGFGSNLQNPKLQIEKAFVELQELDSTRLLVTSSLYKTKPMGPTDQPDFINAVAKILTSLSPKELLTELQEIEARHRRQRGTQRWGPRTLDLDILLYGNLQMDTKQLRIPHYGIAEREFVLIPLQEIEADLIIPGKGILSELIEQLPQYEMMKIET